MDRVTFDNGMNEIFACFQKAPPRGAVLDAVFKRVGDLPDEFMAWAVDAFAEEEKLPMNLGRELLRMFPAWKAANTPVAQYDPYANEASGDPNCPDCKGTGWHYVYPVNCRPGTAPYAVPCLCNTVVDGWDHPPRKASLADLKATGKWTMRRPPMVRNGEPTPLGFSLQQMLDRLRQGRGIQDEESDPRRQMPEYLQ